MAGLELTCDEARLALDVADARVCDFSDAIVDGTPTALIRADVIRRLLLRLPIKLSSDGPIHPVALPSTGLRLRAARIEGEIDLEGAHDSQGLPPLVLEGCVIPKRINLARARLGGLSLKGCKINHLHAPDVSIDGPLDISGVSTAETQGRTTGARNAGLCWIELRGAHIEGGIEAGDSHFAGPTKRPSFVPGLTPSTCALNLSRARVGRLMLQPDMEAIGGVCISGADITSDIWASGAALVAEEGNAFDAQSARICGNVMLGAASPIAGEARPFSAIGDVWLSGADVTGILAMDGANLGGALIVHRAEIGAGVSLSVWVPRLGRSGSPLPFTANGEVNLLGAKIGSLAMDGARLRAGLMAQGAQIDGIATLRSWAPAPGGLGAPLPFSVENEVNFFGASIHGNLSMDGATLGAALNAERIQIGGTATMRAWVPGPAGLGVPLPFIAAGDVNLLGARIAGTLSLDGAQLTGRLIAENLAVGEALTLCAWMPWPGHSNAPLRFSAEGKVSLYGAVIKGNLVMDGAKLGAELSAVNVEVGGAVLLRATQPEGSGATLPFVVKGDVILSGGKVAGTLDINGANLGAALIAEYVEVGGGVTLGVWTPKPDDLMTRSPFTAEGDVNLYGAKIRGSIEMNGAMLGAALMAEGIEVGGGAMLRATALGGSGSWLPFTAKGNVHFLSAKISGNMVMDGAKLAAPLVAGGAAIGGDFRWQVRGDILPIAERGAFLHGAKISGDLVLQGLRLGGKLDLSGIRAGSSLTMSGVTGLDGGPADVHFDLTGAHVGRLIDDPNTWPRPGRLELDGFTYDSIDTSADELDIAGSRLVWLELQFEDGPQSNGLGRHFEQALGSISWFGRRRGRRRLAPPDRFRPQPYEQLAKVLRSLGHSGAADDVAVAKRDHSIRFKSDRWPNRYTSIFIGIIAGHGYKPVRALLWTSLYALFGMIAITFSLESKLIHFRPVDQPPAATDYVWPRLTFGTHGWFLVETPLASDPKGCPAANAPLYALDLILPVIELGQHEACQMEAFGVVGGLVQAVRAAYVIFGTILVAILFSTFSGILRRD